MGDNFGLNDNYEYFEFALDSLDATSSYQTGVSALDWPIFEVAAKGPLQDIVAIKILEAQIPFSWYVFNTANQNFVLNETGFTSQTVTIPVGNYTAYMLAPLLATALNQASGSSGSGNTWTVTYSPSIQRFTFTASTTSFSFSFGSPGSPGIPPNSGNTNPRLYIGFPAGTTAFTGTTLVSPNVDLVSGPAYLYVNSTKLGSDVDIYLPAGALNLGGGKAGPQLAKIPVNVNPGGTILYRDPDPQKWFTYDQLQSLNTFDFFLTLGNGNRILSLNGLSFSLKLGVLRQLKTNIDRVTPTAQNGRVVRREGPKRVRGTY